MRCCSDIVREKGIDLHVDRERNLSGPGKQILFALVLVVHSGMSQFAGAAQYGTTLKGGAYYTSNGNQSPIPAPDLSLLFIWGGTYLNNTPRLSADIKGSVQTSLYKNSGSATIYPQGDAALKLVLMKERLDWVFQDRMEIVRADSQQADIPANQEIANVLITGPNAMVRLGPVDKGLAEARFEIATFQRSPGKDSTKYGGALRWEHDFSHSKSLSTNIEAKKVNAGEAYKRYDGFISFKKENPNNALNLNVGITQIDRIYNTNLTSEVYLIDYVYKPNSRTGWTIVSDRKYADIGDSIISPINLEDPLTRNAGIFLQNGVSLGFNYAYAEKISTVNLFQRRRDYILAAIDEDAKGLIINYTQRIDRDSSLRLMGTYSDTVYSDLANRDIEREVGAEYGFDINRELTWSVGLIYRDRNNVDTTRSFNEKIIYTNLLLKRLNVRR